MTGTTVFSTPGVYSVKMSVTDTTGQTGTASLVNGLDSTIVVYPATGGYIGGGGWITTPRGAFPADPTFIGKASFGFVSTSSRTAQRVSGEIELDLHREGFKFNAINFDSQIVSGARAQIRGTGTVNGAAGYRFLLTTLSADPDAGGTDKIRFKISNRFTGAVIYDTQIGAPDSADPTTPIGSASTMVIEN